jgi:hypothetical protein
MRHEIKFEKLASACDRVCTRRIDNNRRDRAISTTKLDLNQAERSLFLVGPFPSSVLTTPLRDDRESRSIEFFMSGVIIVCRFIVPQVCF